MSPTQFAFEYPFSVGLPLSKQRQDLELPVRYLGIHFTTAHCSPPGLERKQTTTPTAQAMSERYMARSTSSYNRWCVWEFLQFSVYLTSRRLPELSLKCPASGVLTGFDLLMLNLSSAFLIYLSSNNQSFPFFLSWVILMPRICFLGP